MTTFGDSAKKFVRQVQGKSSSGGLIANTRLLDSEKLLDSSRLLIQTKPACQLFQKPKYRLSNYKLEDLFGGPPPRQAWIKTSPVLTKFGVASDVTVEADVGADAKAAEGKLRVKDSVKRHASFGPLTRREVDIRPLRKSIKNASMKENPGLKKNERLVLVKERIFTTTPCKLGGSDELDAGFNAKAPVQFLQLFATAGHHRREECTMEIPPNAVIAYSIEELQELRVANNMDDLEADSICPKLKSSLEESTSREETLRRVWEALQQFDVDVLQPLAELSRKDKSSLYQQLCEALEDETDFEKILENVDGATYESALLLVGALEELPHVAMDMLARCGPGCLKALNTLVTRRKSGQPVSLESLPRSLQSGGEFSWAGEFLCSFETLDELDDLWEETGLHPGVLLLVLSIAVQGLATLRGCA